MQYVKRLDDFVTVGIYKRCRLVFAVDRYQRVLEVKFCAVFLHVLHQRRNVISDTEQTRRRGAKLDADVLERSGSEPVVTR